MCVAAVILAIPVGAHAQPEPPVKELPPLAGDPFGGPAFAPSPSPPTGNLYNAVSANDPYAIPSPVNTEAFLPPPSLDGLSTNADPEMSAWLSAELLIGRTRGPGLLPVVTTGPASAGLIGAGAVGQPTTVPLFGGGRVLNNWRAGVRVEYGVWLDDTRRTGISGRFYSLFSANDQLDAVTNGTTVVNLPQFIPVANSAIQFPIFVGFPGVTAGSVSATTHTSFAGGDVNFRRTLGLGDNYRLDLLGGYRQMQLRDSLGTAFNVVGIGGDPATAPRLSGSDRVHTANDFYGPQLGVYGATGWRRFTVEAHGAIAPRHHGQ